MTPETYFALPNPSFEQLQEFIDSILSLDTTKLDYETARNPKIFTTVYRLLRVEAKRLRETMVVFGEVENKRTAYYSGKASGAEYKAEPLNIKLMKSEVPAYLAVDEKYLAAKEFVNEADLRVKMVEGAIKLAHSRTYEIKNALQWKQLTQSN